MAKTLEDKVDDLKEVMSNLTTKVECHLTEFVIYKKFVTKVGYVILAGILGILGNLYWEAIISSPSIVANVVAALNVTP